MNFQFVRKRSGLVADDGSDENADTAVKTWMVEPVGSWNWKRSIAFAVNVLNVIVGLALVSLSVNN